MSRGPVIGALVVVGIVTAAGLMFWSPSTGPELSRATKAPAPDVVEAEAVQPSSPSPVSNVSPPERPVRGHRGPVVVAGAARSRGAGPGARTLPGAGRVRHRYTEDGAALTAKAVNAFAEDAEWDDALRDQVDEKMGESFEAGEAILAAEEAGAITVVEASRQLMKLQATEGGALRGLLGDEEAKQFVLDVGIGGLGRRGVAGNRRRGEKRGRSGPAIK